MPHYHFMNKTKRWEGGLALELANIDTNFA